MCSLQLVWVLYPYLLGLPRKVIEEDLLNYHISRESTRDLENQFGSQDKTLMNAG